MSSIRFKVIVLTLLTFSMYKKLSEKINTSHPLIHTYMRLSEVRNNRFSITFSKAFTIIEKEYPYLETIDLKTNLNLKPMSYLNDNFCFLFF